MSFFKFIGSKVFLRQLLMAFVGIVVLIVLSVFWLDFSTNHNQKIEVPNLSKMSLEEVEETLNNKPKFRFVEKGQRKGEDVYMALGQTDSGRHLSILFIYKRTKEALILSARDMADKERKQYGKK